MALERNPLAGRRGQAPLTLTVEDTLDGGGVLLGFKLVVKEIFPT